MTTGKPTLKSYFNIGDIPTEAQFAELIDAINPSVIQAIDYGVVGDGVTDNSVALQAAIDAAEATYGTLELPYGDCLFGTTLNVKGPIRIRGNGSIAQWYGTLNGTTLRYTGAENAIKVYSPVDNSIVQDIYFENFALRPHVSGSATDGFLLDASDASMCLAIRGVTFQDVKVEYFGQDGIHTKGTVYDIIMNRISLNKNIRHGLHLEDVGSQAGGPSQITLNDPIITPGYASTSWGVMTYGTCPTLRVIGGTVAGVGYGNGLRLFAGATIVGTSIEGVSNPGTIGIRYKGAVGMFLGQCVIHYWGIGVQIGDPLDKVVAANGWTIGADISNNTIDLHLVDGGNRIGLIWNYGYAGSFVVQNDRLTIDGVHNDYATWGTHRGIAAYDDGATFVKNFADTGFTLNRNTAISSGTWATGHLLLGNYHLWVDETGDLRIKNGSPSFDLDGTVVGAQTA